jgi:sedoheptulokinase
MQAIGIDIGTTSICGIVIDTETGACLQSITKDSNAFLSSDAPWEKIQSVQTIVTIAKDILHALISPQTCVIGVTGQMHGILYVDENGTCVSPLYTWQDGRGNQPYGDTTYADFLGSSSGYGCVTDFYNRENGLVPPNACGFCAIHDYFVMELCGLKHPLVHVSDAASFGLFDLKTKEFHYPTAFTVLDGYHMAGTYQNIPVSVAIGDNQASVLSTLSSNDALLVNIGTGSQVSVICDDIVSGSNIETRPFFEGKYLAVGAALCGGRAYATLKDFYKALLAPISELDDTAVYELMFSHLKEVSPALMVDTRFEGTRMDKSIRGSIENISTSNFTPAALTKGVLVGMVTELYDMYLIMGKKVTGIVGSGNGIRKNRDLANTISQIFGCPLKIPNHTEEAAFGAALYALLSSGRYQNINEARTQIKYITNA